jgi:BolA protein
LTKRGHGRIAAAMSATETVKHTITNKLREAFMPESLEVTDESHLHEGHAGHRPGGETHFRLYIVSQAFEGKSRVERHRMINAALAAELAGPVHALAIKAQAPGESGGFRGP